MIVGLTGGIGSGKSSAAKFFIELGIDVIDADEVSKNILDSNIEAKDKFVDTFGNEFLDTNNKIDRSLLRSEIFKDEQKKTLLESIIHPLVREQILKFIENSKSIYKIIMVPLIFETKSESFYDKIVVVDCEEEIQIKRASNRDKKSTDNIINIMKAQASRQERNSIADIIIMNNNSLEDLKKEVTTTHQKLHAIRYQRKNGSLPIEVRRGGRAMFYQGRAMNALTVIAIIAENQGYNIWDYDHKSKGKNFHNLVKFFIDFTENNEIVFKYAKEMKAPGPAKDYRNQDLKIRRSSNWGWFYSYATRFPNHKNVKRIENWVNNPENLNKYQMGFVHHYNNIGKRTFGDASWTVVEANCHFLY